jgi:hypothetical protein
MLLIWVKVLKLGVSCRQPEIVSRAYLRSVTLTGFGTVVNLTEAAGLPHLIRH